MRAPLILAVDDDPVNLDIIALTFEGCGFELRFADGGAQAIAMLSDERELYDAVLLDRMMPGTDGLDVLRWMKSVPRLSKVPVVMQTAAASSEQVVEGLRAGAYYYLTKPYAPEALRTIVTSALEDAMVRGEADLRSASRLRVLGNLKSGSFVIRTLTEASDLAELLASLCPDATSAFTGLLELLANAVEHGNLDITYAEKSELKRNNAWRDEVDRRAELPEYRDRRVRVGFDDHDGVIKFVIRDEGKGFDWRRYLEFDPERAFDPNGRGIAIARAMSFSELRYEASGSIAVATIRRGTPVAAAAGSVAG